jgi:hypothetical protein
MLQCTIQISSYDLTHHFLIPYRNNHAISSDVATPQPTSLSYKIILPPSRRFLRVSQRLRFSVTQFLPHHRENPFIIPKDLRISQRRDTDEEAENIAQSWHLSREDQTAQRSTADAENIAHSRRLHRDNQTARR